MTFSFTLLFLIFSSSSGFTQENCLNFDGIDDYVNLGTISPVGNFSTGFTYEAWVKWDAFNVSSRLLDIGIGTTDNICISNQVADQGHLKVTVYNGSTESQIVAPDILTLSVWQHVAVTIDDVGNTIIYIDGNIAYTGVVSVPLDVARNSCFIGKSNWGTDGYFDGEIDEVRIWDTVRTQTEIQNFMNNSLIGNEPNLVAYYDFNQGVAGGQNGSELSLIDRTIYGNTGTLYNFDLMGGAISNWVSGVTFASGAAGDDGETCDGTYTMMATEPMGTWSIVSGNASFSDINDPQATVSNLALGPNVFGWNFMERKGYDEVTITNNEVVADAGMDNSVASSNYTLTANNPTYGTGEWSLVSGGGTFTNTNSPTTEVINMSQGLNTYRWTVTAGTCTINDEVNITNIATSQDSLALVALYNSTDGANWTNNTNWLTGNLDTWFGVTVTTGRVTQLQLYGNNLIGTIPVEIGNLTNLTGLSLVNNQLSGSIPHEIGNLTNLSDFRLEGNNFDSLPDLSALINLGYAYIYDNNFTFADLTTANLTASTDYSYQPQKEVTLNQTQFYVEEGSNFTLDITALSDGQISDPGNVYQWYYNSNPISGATAAIYTINNFSQTEDGIYYCEITNTNFPDLTLKSQDITIETQTLENGLVAHYPFNGNANDESGNGNDGIINGATLTPDRFNNQNAAYLFNGTDAQITLTNTIQFDSNDFTISGWFNCTNTVPFQYLWRSGVGGNSELGIYINNDTLLLYGSSIESNFYLMSTQKLEENTWYNYAIKREGNNFYMYINGEEDLTGYFEVGDVDFEGASVSIGYNYSTPGEYFNGIIDDINVYNRALTATEIMTMYNVVGSAYAGTDQEVCEDFAQLSAENPAPYTGEWLTTASGSGVFANATNFQTQVTGLSPGINHFEWTVNVNGNIYRDTVMITSNAVTAFAGNDTTIYWQTYPIPTAEMQMRADAVSLPAVGIWTTNSPNAWFANDTQANTMVHDLRAGLNRLTWTVSNGNCVVSDDVLVFSSNNIHNKPGVKGVWNSVATWTPEVVPTQWDSVTIQNGTVDITGYVGNCRQLRVGSAGILTIKEGSVKDNKMIAGELHSKHLFIEQDVEKSRQEKGYAEVNVGSGGHLFIEQDVEKAVSGDGINVGSGGHLFIEQDVEKNKLSDAQVTINGGKSLYIKATQPTSMSPEATVQIGDGGHLFIEQDVEKTSKGLSNDHGIVVGDGGHLFIEQDVEKAKAPAEVIIRDGGHLFIEQDVEKSSKSLGSEVTITGGHLFIEQDVEKGNVLGNLVVRKNGTLTVNPGINGVTGAISTPKMQIKGGNVVIGNGAKAATSGITSGHLFIEQDVEKGQPKVTSPNLTLNGNGELNFYTLPGFVGNAYIDIMENCSFTMASGSKIIADNTTATIYMEDGASFIDETQGTGIPGEVIMEQNLIPGEKLIASPVTGFLNTIFESSTVYSWDETNTLWNEITGTQPLIVSQGYKLTTNALDTIAYVGEFAYGAQSFTLSNNLTNTNLNTRGWNLAGNPYTSAIDWEQVTLSGIENTVYTFDENIQNFRVYQKGGISLNGADQFISTAEGVFVKSHPEAIAPILNFGNAKVHKILGLYTPKQPKVLTDVIKFKVTGDTYYDEALVAFSETNLSTYESDYDAFKLESLNSEAPSLYTKTPENIELSIDVRNYPATESIIPLNFEGIAGDYQISIPQFDLASNYRAKLKDLQSEAVYDISSAFTYNFTTNNGDSPERFELIFNDVTSVNNISENENIRIYAGNNEINISTTVEGKHQIRISDISGKVVYFNEFSGKGLHKINFNKPAGVYFVNVKANSILKTEKVFVK